MRRYIARQVALDSHFAGLYAEGVSGKVVKFINANDPK